MRINPSGLIIAVLGFFVTRFIVTLTFFGDPLAFIIGGIMPLALGLSLSAFGIALTVGSFENWYVRTVTMWTIIGFFSIGVLITLTAYGIARDELMSMDVPSIFSNVFIGGGVGGALTGIYAAKNKRQRMDLIDKKNRLIILNRFLRDEIINSVSVIKAHGKELEKKRNSDFPDYDQVVEVILEHADSIQSVMEDVKYLSKTGNEKSLKTKSVSVKNVVERAVNRIKNLHPSVEFNVDEVPDSLYVSANENIDEIFFQLAKNSIKNSDLENSEININVDWEDDKVKISIKHSGKSLGENDIKVLDSGLISEYDDPSENFGLNIVRFLTTAYNGSINTKFEDGRTAISVSLPRADTENSKEANFENKENWSKSSKGKITGVLPEKLTVIVGISLVAGIFMAVFINYLFEAVPLIGSLYGANNVFVGIITHEFHSVVFGFVYVSFLSVFPSQYTENSYGQVAIALIWSIFLWIIAASIIMPIWLQFVGIPSPVPNFQFGNLVGHMIWGLSLGILYSITERVNLSGYIREIGGKSLVLS